MQDNMIGPNPYNADCFAPRDRLTWLHIMAETTNLSDGDLTLAEQKLIARDTTPRSEDFDEERQVKQLDDYLRGHYDDQWSLIMKLAGAILQEDFKTKKARTSCLTTLKDTVVSATTDSGGLDFYALLSKISPVVAAEIKMPPAQKEACRYMFEVDYDLYCLYRTSVDHDEDDEDDEDDTGDELARQAQCINKKWPRMQAKEKLERKVEAIHATWAAFNRKQEKAEHAIDKKRTALLVTRLKEHDSVYWNAASGFYDLDEKMLCLLLEDMKHGIHLSVTKRSAGTKKGDKKTSVPKKVEPATAEEKEEESTLTALKDLTISKIANMTAGADTIDRKALEAQVLKEVALPIPHTVIKRYSAFNRKLLKLIETKRDQLLKDEGSLEELEAVNDDAMDVEALLREDFESSVAEAVKEDEEGAKTEDGRVDGGAADTEGEEQ